MLVKSEMTEKTGKMFKMHRLRLFSPENLHSINCLALNENQKKLAVLRRCLAKEAKDIDNRRSLIEIWNIENIECNFIEQTIVENEREPNLIEAIAWGANGRLFSCGLNAHFNEYNLNKGMKKKSYAVTSGPAWCLHFDSTLTYAAVGTEDGYVCIFTLGDGVVEDEVNFDRTLVKSDTRILCLEWCERQGSKLIVTGSIGTIKIWSYDSRQCLDVIRVGNESTVVWCLTVFSDTFTIVTGDSDGKTSFWDGKSTTLIQEYKYHKADVLCICKADGGSVYTSGVDSSIMQFKPTKQIAYIPGNALNIHSHDVRALIRHSSGWLFSGGIDVYLVKSFYPPKKIVRYCPDFTDLVHIDEDYVMFQYTNHIEVWKMGYGDDDYLPFAKEGSYLPLKEDPNKVIELTTTKVIQKSAFKQNWIAYSTFDKLKVFTFSKQTIQKVPLVCEPLNGVVDKMDFSGTNYLVVSTGILLYVFHLDASGIVVHYMLPSKTRITAMCCSQKFIAIKSLEPHVTVFDITNGNEICHFKVDFFPLSMKFNNSENELWFSTSDHWLVQYNLKSKKSEKTLKLKQLDVFTPIKDVVFTNCSVLAHTENLIVSVKKGKQLNKPCLRFRHVAKLSFPSSRSDELIVVEVTPESIFKRLPQVLHKKQFGE